MDPKGLKQIFRGTTRESGSTPDGLDTEMAQIRTRPPFSRKDLIISQNVMKNVCTSLTCDVCGEPAEVRCNCCKFLFCSTLCLLKSEPKHKIVCETSSQVFTSQKDNLELLNTSSDLQVDVAGQNALSQPAVDEEKDVKLLNLPLQPSHSLSRAIENCEKIKTIKSNLENKGLDELPKVQPLKEIQPHKPMSVTYTTLMPPTKFLGKPKWPPTDSQETAQLPPAQAEVNKSPSTSLPLLKPIPIRETSSFPGAKVTHSPMRETSTFPGAKVTLSPMRETSPSFSGAKVEVTPPITPPLKPNALKQEKIPTELKPLLGIQSSVTPQNNGAAAPIIPPVQKEPEITPEPSPQPSVMQNESQLLQTLKASEKIDVNQFTPVQIVTTESKDLYWVLDLDSYDKTFAYDAEIRNSAELPLISKPQINMWCSVIHDSDWYRAAITGLSPLTVFLMDIGIEKTVKNAFELPESLHDDPPLAVKVWAKDAPPEILNLPISTAVMIRGVGQFPGGIIVEMKLAFSGGTDVIASVKKDLKMSRNHVLDEVYARNLSFCVRINKTVGNCGVIGSIILDVAQETLPNYTDCDSMRSLLSHSSPNPIFSPEINDLVSAKLGDFWYRGLVCQKSNDDTKVALIDYGLIIQPHAICALPDKLHGLCATAVRLNFKQPLQNILDLTGDRLKGSLSKSGEIKFEIGTANIEAWDAKPEDFPESVFPFYSGMSVVIVTYFSTCSIYLQPADCPEMFTFLEAVNIESKSAPEITRKLFCGEMVACLFEGGFFRAKILNQQGLSYQVLFVDYGNTETVGIKYMKDLNNRFKTVPYYAIKVGLAQLAKSGFNTDSRDLIDKFVSHSIRLKLEIESTLDTVQLITPQGESLNSMLIEKLSLDTKFIFKHNNLKYEQYRPGNEIKMAIVQITENNNIFAMNLESGVMEVLDNFTEQLTLYCSDYQGSYKPSLEEVVAAKYEDGRSYRAICINIFEDTCEVFFVDYGNYATVKFQDICPIGGEFMSYPVPVKECSIYGMSVFSPAERREIIVNLIGKVENAVVINDMDDKASVFMPCINNALRFYKKTEIVAPPLCNF